MPRSRNCVMFFRGFWPGSFSIVNWRVQFLYTKSGWFCKLWAFRGLAGTAPWNEIRKRKDKCTTCLQLKCAVMWIYAQFPGSRGCLEKFSRTSPRLHDIRSTREVFLKMQRWVIKKNCLQLSSVWTSSLLREVGLSPKVHMNKKGMLFVPCRAVKMQILV